MTVAEMMAELQKMEPGLPVSIEGYELHTELGNRAYDPNLIECLQDGAGRKSVVIWGALTHDGVKERVEQRDEFNRNGQDRW